MDNLPDIANILIWPLVVLIVAVVFLIIFKDRLTELELDPARRKMRFKFARRLDQARLQAKKIEKSIAASGALPSAQRMDDIGKQRSREAVIEAWGALKQTVYNAAAAFHIKLTPSTSIQMVLSQMVYLGVLDHETADLILLLEELGRELTTDEGLKPHIDDARAYKALAEVIIDWMMLELISKKSTSKRPETRTAAPQRRSATVVGGFATPVAGQPSATLVGIKGVVNGRSIPIETAEFKIGSGPGNDLLIQGDDYVSGNHAVIRFDRGSLYLTDLNSRNGTYINEIQVNQAVTALQSGDQIRLGQTVFQLE